MNDLLSLLDSLPSDAVPSQCLTIADFLGERGDREAEGWMALGALGKQPARWGPLWNWNNRTQWTWLNPFNRLLRHFSEDNAVRIEWHRVLRDATHGDLLWDTRSLALRAAAQAFVGLEDRVKREILGTKLEVVG